MKPKKGSQFSWSELLSVTAVSFLAFSGLTRLINGSNLHSALFIKIGIVSLMLSTFTYVVSLKANPAEKKKSRSRF